MPSQRQQAILDHHGLHVVRALQNNPGKGLSVSLVADADGQLLVMKFCDASDPRRMHDFRNEKQFYSENRIDFAPRMVHAGEDYLCIEHIDGTSLLESLQQDEFGADEIGRLADEQVKMARFFAATPNNGPGDPDDFAKQYMRYLAKLSLSGPWGSSRPKVEEFLLRRCWRVLRPLLARRISVLLKRVPRIPGQSATHNDFHQNNILIDNQSKLHLIDFENYGPGYWTIDLIYGLSTLYAAARIDPAAIFNAIKGPCRSYPELKPLLAIALCVVGTNRKFRKGTLTGVIVNLARVVGYSMTGSGSVLMGRQ